MLNKNKLLFITVLFISRILLAGTSIFGLQNGYLGEYQYQYSAIALGRGGFAMGISDSLSVNQVNFAQWAYLPRSMFVINGRYDGLYSEINNSSIYSSDFNFKGGYLIIPVLKKKLAMGIGLTPVLVNNQTIQIKESSETHLVEISGNISDAKFILSYLINTKLSVSLQTRYIFGNIRDYNKRSYNQGNSRDVSYNNRYRLHGVGLGLSALYRINNKFASGIQVSLPAELSMQTTKASVNPLLKYEDRDVTLPLMVNVGGAYYLKDQWLVGMDLNLQNWKTGYKIDNTVIDDMNNSFRLGAGTEYLPPKKRFIPFLQRLTYRGGVFWGKFNTFFNENEVYEYGFSLGLGLPVGLTPNHLDVAFEFGSRGDLASNSGKETFFKFHLTFTASELWFVKYER